MHKPRPKLFRGRHFRDEIIVLCVRWYLRYSLSYRDLEELMAERGLSLDHSTAARWVLRYAPELSKRIRRHLRRPGGSWRVDETYVRVAGRWTYLYRALDSEGNTKPQPVSRIAGTCIAWNILLCFGRQLLHTLQVWAFHRH